MKASGARRVALLAVAGALALAAGLFVGRSAAAPPTPADRITHIHGLEAPAWAHGDLFVATHTGLVRLDAEDGAWYEVGDVRHDLMGFRSHPSEQGVLFASGHPDLRSGLANPIGFVRSRDAGVTWERVSLAGEADFHALTAQHADADLLYGFDVAIAPGLLRSNDGGGTWERVDDGGALLRAGGAAALDVHPNEPGVVLAGTPAGLLRSDDGGRSWRTEALDGVSVTAVRYLDPEGRTVAVYGADDGVGLVIGRDGGIGREGGRSWDALGLVLEGADAVGSVVPHPTDPDTLYVGTFGHDVLVTEDGGVSWRHLVLRGLPVDR